MYKKNDRVKHKKLGHGIVVEHVTVNVRVKWDSHRVTRATYRLPPDETHVNPKNLTLVSS